MFVIFEVCLKAEDLLYVFLCIVFQFEKHRLICLVCLRIQELYAYVFELTVFENVLTYVFSITEGLRKLRNEIFNFIESQEKLRY